MKCYYCGEEIAGFRTVAFVTILSERIPLHLTPCLDEYQKQSFQVPAMQPAPSNE